MFVIDLHFLFFILHDIFMFIAKKFLYHISIFCVFCPNVSGGLIIMNSEPTMHRKAYDYFATSEKPFMT